MPLYEYSCKKCGEEFEELVMGGDESDVRCPSCKSKKVKRMMSAFAHKSGDSFVPSTGGSGCSSCSSGSCSSCGH